MKNGVVAGAGVLLDTREVSFTCDGKLQGIAFRQVPKEPDLYPAISFSVARSVVEVSFRQSQFRFDLTTLPRRGIVGDG